MPTGLRLARFELVFLRELGYSPVLRRLCGLRARRGAIAIPSCEPSAPSAGGMLCPACQPRHRDRRRVLPDEPGRRCVALNDRATHGDRPGGPTRACAKFGRC